MQNQHKPFLVTTKQTAGARTGIRYGTSAEQVIEVYRRVLDELAETSKTVIVMVEPL